MKKLILSSVFFLMASVSFAQWEPDFRMTNDTSVRGLMTHSALTAVDSLVHAVFFDERDGNFEIYYKRSSDFGLNWGADTRITNHSGNSTSVRAAVSGSVVHIVWQDDRSGFYKLYYKRSLDGGLSWEPVTRLTNDSNSGTYLYPSIAVSASDVHIAWIDYRNGNPEIYYKRSPDNGLSWGSDIRVTNNPATSWYPEIAASGTSVHIVWEDERDGPGREIYHKRSLDGGLSWEPVTRLTNNSAVSTWSCVAVSGSLVHVIWNDSRDGNSEIYYKRSPDNGLSWGSDVRVTTNPSSSKRGSIAVSDSTIHILWDDDRDGNAEMYYKYSVNTGLSWEPVTRLTDDTARSGFGSIAVSGSVIHTLWQDIRNGNWEIYYKRNPTGNTSGKPHINLQNTILPGKFSLFQNFPNPFNPNTKINFSIPQKSGVTIKVYDLQGAEVSSLVNQLLEAGNYSIDFDGTNLSSGVYFYRITAGIFTDTKKMMIIK